jgi:hypothetical protein
MRAMKRTFIMIMTVAISAVMTVSCTGFLKEEPKTFE